MVKWLNNLTSYQLPFNQKLTSYHLTRQRERGAALVECAIVFSLVLLLVLGIAQLAYIAYASALMDDAAQAAARAKAVELNNAKALAAAGFVLLPLRRMASSPGGKNAPSPAEYMRNIVLRSYSQASIRNYVQGLLPLEVNIKEVHTGKALDYDKHRHEHGPKKIEIPTVYAHVASPTQFWKKEWRCVKWKKGRCVKHDWVKVWHSCQDKDYGCANYYHWYKVGGVDGNGNFYYWKTNAETPRYYPKLHTDRGTFNWITSGHPTTYGQSLYDDWGCKGRDVICNSNQGYDCSCPTPGWECKGHKEHWVKIENKMDEIPKGKERDIDKDKGPLVVEATVKLKIRVMFPRIFGTPGKNYLLLTSTCRMMKEDESW